MEQFIIDQVTYGLKYLPANLAKSFFIKRSSEETKKLRKDFILGVCHPNENYKLIREANIGWIRIDIPYPYDKDGNISVHYEGFKARCKGYVDNGIRVMAVTPYPQPFIENGLDPRCAENEEGIRDVARFLAKDLQGLVGAFQVTNEMGIPRFTIPLKMDEAARFIAIQLEALYPVKGDILIGYNSAGPQADLHTKLRDYHKYCDYVGVDIYLGCFYGAPGFMWLFDALLRYLWALTGKPVLLQEFGYIGAGAPKTKEEKKAILGKYGAVSEKDAKEHIETFVENMPQHFKEHVKYLAEGDPKRYTELLFNSDLTNHLYCELPRTTKIPGYEHTPEGQAKFYRDILQRLYDQPYVCGSIIYCWQDSDKCYVCGQAECPTETVWGLTDRNGNPKPAYYAVQKAMGHIRWEQNTEK